VLAGFLAKGPDEPAMEAFRNGIVNGVAAFYDQALEWLAAHAGTRAQTQCARRYVKGLAQA
jgi:hypothetical protein